MSNTTLYLVAVDGSEWSNRAAHQAVALARETGAAVHLQTVIPWSGFTPMSAAEVGFRPLEKKEEERHAKDDILAPLLKDFEGESVSLTSDYTWGQPVETIHKIVQDKQANMLFAGRRGRSRVLDMLMGSVSNALAHKASVPIVLVP